MAIDAVVFDIGNVLVEWQPERFFDTQIGEDRRKALFAAVDLHEMNHRVDLGENFSDTVLGMADQHPEWRAEITIWHDRWLDMAAPRIDRSVRLLRALRAKEIPVFALTNFGVQTFALAEAEYEFLNEFDRRYISGHMRMAKPAANIYAEVEADSGIAPDRLIFADDRTDNIAAAAAREWQTHLFEHPQGWADRLVQEGLLTEAEAA
ncbi:MAG: HAD-IA family hydrolase [Rhodobacteraceae bacterium]|nr:HAD-IA family hydrolase [Paracoccaceae bacterium]